MKTRLRFAAAVSLAAALVAGSGYALAQAKPVPVSSKNADQVLMPGDIMLKLLNSKSKASAWGITISESAIKAFYSGFSEAAAKGNPAAVHVAVYVGNGQTAEAHGSSDEDSEGVSLRQLEHHAGFLWFVFRPTNAGLGADAAQVARAWSTQRMKYKLPWDVALHNSSFGPKAKAEAMRYGKAASTRGGPPGDDDMFCSQFAIAVYQATVVADQLHKNPKIKSDDLKMWQGVDRQASYTSPLVLHGHLQDSKAGFKDMGLIIVQKSAAVAPAPPKPGSDGASAATPKQGEFVTFKGLGGKCLDAAWLKETKSAGRGSKIQLWDCHGRSNQQWKFTATGIESAIPGMCLSVSDGKLASGQPLILWNCHGGNDQKWVGQSDTLALAGSSLCADVRGEKRDNGTEIILWKCGKDKANQRWTVVKP